MQKGITNVAPKRVGGGYFLAPRTRVYRPPDLGLRPINEETEVDIRRPLSRKDEALLRAAIAGDDIGLKAAIRQGANLDCADEVGHTAVIKAARHNNFKCLAALVNAKANLDKQDENGWTALFWAAQTGSTSCVDELIRPKNCTRKGCDLNIKSHASLRAHHVAINSEVLSLLKKAPQLRAEAVSAAVDPTDDPEDFSAFAPVEDEKEKADKKKLSSRVTKKTYKGVRRARMMLLNAWGYHSECDSSLDSTTTKSKQRPQSAPAMLVQTSAEMRLSRKKEDFEAMSQISREMVSEPKTEPMVHSALWKYQERTPTISFGNWAEAHMQGF